MTDLEIIEAFKKHHPKSEGDMQALGLNPVECGRGCARRVYKLSEGLAVKVPHNDHAAHQSRTEIAVLEKIHSNPLHEGIRHLIPPLYYGDKEAGVVLTKFYVGEVAFDEDKFIRPIIDRLTNLGLWDLFAMNFRKDEHGNYIAVDLGHASPDYWSDEVVP
jgi:hypothetical protein